MNALKHGRLPRYTHNYGCVTPEEFSEWDQRELTKRAARRGMRRIRPRRKFFGVAFPAGSDTQYVIFTERLRDACNIVPLDSEDAEAEIVSLPRAPVPDGAELGSPEPICDADWRALADDPRYRSLVSGSESRRAGKLANEVAGVRFDGGSKIGNVFVLSDTMANVDIFVRRPGKSLRPVVHLPATPPDSSTRASA